MRTLEYFVWSRFFLLYVFLLLGVFPKVMYVKNQIQPQLQTLPSKTSKSSQRALNILRFNSVMGTQLISSTWCVLCLRFLYFNHAMFFYFIFSLSQAPQEIQLKASSILLRYTIWKKVDKLQAKNISLNELVKYYKKRDKQKKLTNRRCLASDEAKKVCIHSLLTQFQIIFTANEKQFDFQFIFSSRKNPTKHQPHFHMPHVRWKFSFCTVLQSACKISWKIITCVENNIWHPTQLSTDKYLNFKNPTLIMTQFSSIRMQSNQLGTTWNIN